MRGSGTRRWPRQSRGGLVYDADKVALQEAVLRCAGSKAFRCSGALQLSRRGFAAFFRTSTMVSGVVFRVSTHSRSTSPRGEVLLQRELLRLRLRLPVHGVHELRGGLRELLEPGNSEGRL